MIRFLLLLTLAPMSHTMADGLSEFAITEKDEGASAAWKKTARVSLDMLYMDYREDLELPHKSIETGLLPTFRLEFETAPPESRFFSRSALGASFGSLDYDGALQDRNGNYMGDYKEKSSATLFDLATTAGIRLQLSDQLQLSPYTGLGYHSWRRGDTHVVNGVLTFKENYSWLYVPIGAELRGKVSESLQAGANLSLILPFAGSMKVADTSDATVSLGSKPGFRVALPFEYKITSDISAVWTPWYERSAIGESDINEQYDFYEPASRTHQFGSQFGIAAEL